MDYRNNQCGVSCVLFQKFWYKTRSPLPTFSIRIWLIVIRLNSLLQLFIKRFIQIKSSRAWTGLSLMSTVSHHLNNGFHNWADQPKLFTIWSCWTIYTLLCLIAFCASVQCTHSQWHMHWHTVFKHACCQVSSYHCPSFLPVYGEYIPVLLWGIVWINELSDITLYDEICPHCTLHMMNWVPRRQNEASAVFVCRYVFRKWESPVQECGKYFKYTIFFNIV